jgi:hypothetical protein
MKHPILAAALAATAAVGLSGCATDGYGYSGVSLGYGSGGYYGDPYWGWYDDFYYPGAGYYIYDRGGVRHRWNDRQRAYWEGRRGNRASRENWTGYRGGTSAGTAQAWQQRRDAWRAQRQQQGSTATDQTWAQRREAWRAQNQTQSPSQSQSGATSTWRGRGNWGGGGWNGTRGGRHRGN